MWVKWARSKRWANFVVGVGTMLAVLGFPPSRGRSAPDSRMGVTPILEQMAQAVRRLRTLRAALSQEKFYAQLGFKDPPEKGVLYMKRRGERDLSLRIEITVPEKRIITVTGDRFLLYQPRINQAIEGVIDRTSVRAAAGFLAYLFNGLAQAAEDYEITLAGYETIQGRRASHLVLTPKPNRRGVYRRVDLWVDHQLWLPTIQKIVEANRDETLLTLDEVQLNVNLPDSLFVQKLPPGVQRVRG
ncbi:Outer-membrane lipoprotein carrier protein [bacterium HR08]|nr:Outer-membrane lipoprotein carrier protein [bacterium HR08]